MLTKNSRHPFLTRAFTVPVVRWCILGMLPKQKLDASKTETGMCEDQNKGLAKINQYLRIRRPIDTSTSGMSCRVVETVHVASLPRSRCTDAMAPLVSGSTAITVQRGPSANGIGPMLLRVDYYQHTMSCTEATYPIDCSSNSRGRVVGRGGAPGLGSIGTGVATLS